MSKAIITFVKNWRGYAAGETAGFDEAVATELIDGGYAAEAGKEAGKKDIGGKGSQKTSANKNASATLGTAESGDTNAGNSGAEEEGKP